MGRPRQEAREESGGRQAVVEAHDDDRVTSVHNSNRRGASPPLLDHDLHAIDATPARWRGVVVYYRSFQPGRPRRRREMT